MAARGHRTIIIAALCIATVYILSLSFLPEARFGDLGSRDFVQYWAACRVLELNANPYDPVAMLAAQRTVGMTWQEPVMMWNPPWTLGALCPVLSVLGFSASLKLWFVLGLSGIAACALMTWKIHAPGSSDYRLAFLSAFLFVPAIDALSSGQMGILFGVSLCSFAALKRANRPFGAGLSLIPLLFKPYLFHMLFLAILLEAVRDRSWRSVIGILAGFGFLSIVAGAARPAIFSEWWSAVNAESFAIPVLTVWEWRPDALSGEIRALFGGGARWIALAVPLCADALLLIALARGGVDRRWEISALELAALSIFTAPYAWFSDQAALVPIAVGSVAIARGRPTVVALFALQLALALGHVHWKTFWYPLTAALVWRASVRRSRER